MRGRLRTISHVMKSAGILIVGWWAIQNHISDWPLGLGVILLLFSWYALDFHYFRERRRLMNDQSSSL